MTSNISPYQSYIIAPITANPNDFVVSQGTIERLRSELPEMYRQSRFLSSGFTLVGLLQKAFFHIHNNFPIFHRPTMQVDDLPTYLILTIASFGGLLSDDGESQHFGLTLHNHVRDFVFSVCFPFVRLMANIEAYDIFAESRSVDVADHVAAEYCWESTW